MPRTGQPAIRLVGAVQRAFSVVDALAEADAELGTNEIARRTGINASSVSRLLATLVAGGLVEPLDSLSSAPSIASRRSAERIVSSGGGSNQPKARGSGLPQACSASTVPARSTRRTSGSS